MSREIKWTWDVVNMETKYMVDGKVAEEAIIVSDKTEPKKNANILAEHAELCGEEEE